MDMEKVYLISNIEEYGKFISFCIENDICVFRTYWDEREKGKRCYSISWPDKRCYYSDRSYYENVGFSVLTPHFVLDEFGNYKLLSTPVEPEKNKNENKE